MIDEAAVHLALRRSTLVELTLASVFNYVSTNIPETTLDFQRRSSPFITTSTGIPVLPVLSTSAVDINTTTDDNDITPAETGVNKLIH